jgi:predicted O-methyltransferase YrrM
VPQERTQRAGSLPGLKNVFYKIVHSTLPRQLRRAPTSVESIDADDQPPTTQTKTLASCGQVQDQAELNGIRPLRGFNHVYTAPAEMRMPERVLLYSLVFGLQPRNCLEIGTFRGGSSAIICGALEDTGFGRLVCVDPSPQIDPQLWSQISARCRIVEGFSPDILPDVARQTGAAFDFVLIDGHHQYEFVRRDIAGVLPVLADRAYVLFHDANHAEVKRAIDEALVENCKLTDCGLLSVEPTVLQEKGKQVTWAGMRLLKFQR